MATSPTSTPGAGRPTGLIRALYTGFYDCLSRIDAEVQLLEGDLDRHELVIEEHPELAADFLRYVNLYECSRQSQV